jgi:hypothetical protein
MEKESAMKKIIKGAILIVLCISIYYSLLSNPIVINLFNELAFTPTGWVLEINPPGSVSTNGWYLVTKQDTAHLKTMILTENTLHLITQDSLLEPLDIDQYGDTLTLCSQGGTPMFYLIFDSIKVGQSICRGSFSYYLDNSPTLGQENDTVNATGHIDVLVKDESDVPLSNVKVAYPAYRYVYNPPYEEGWQLYYDTTLTDSEGLFKFSGLSGKKHLSFICNNFLTQYHDVKVSPESTITMNVIMSPVASVEKIESNNIPQEFSISDPFPNPFNPEMQIQYSLPQNGDVRIDVFDISGKLVDKIFSGFQSAGKYQAHWNAASFPSSIYIIRIQSDEFVLSKKCALVK